MLRSLYPSPLRAAAARMGEPPRPFDENISLLWLRRARWAVGVFFGAFAFFGLAYVYYAAIRGDILGSLIGAASAWGAIGLGIGMNYGLQLASVIRSNRVILEGLRLRIEALEVGAASGGNGYTYVPGPRSRGVSSPSVVTVQDAFSPVVPLEGDELGAGGRPVSARPLENQADRWSALDASATRTRDELRDAFRQAVSVRDFDVALAVGEEILDQDPVSDLSRQFLALRPLLEDRAGTAGV